MSLTRNPAGAIAGRRASWTQCSTVGPYGRCVEQEGHEGKCTTFISGRTVPESPLPGALKGVANALRDAQLDSYYEPFLFDALSDLMRAIGRPDAASAADRLKADPSYDRGYEDGREAAYYEGYDEGYDEGEQKGYDEGEQNT